MIVSMEGVPRAGQLVILTGAQLFHGERAFDVAEKGARHVVHFETKEKEGDLGGERGGGVIHFEVQGGAQTDQVGAENAIGARA